MKRLIVILLSLLPVVTAIAAKDYSWVCAVEWTEEQPEWVFVYEDIKRNNDGTYRAFIQWEFTNDPSKAYAIQTWLISSDFDQIRVMGTVGYDKQNNVAYTDSTPQNWKYVLPETYAEAIVQTIREILSTQ